MYHRRGCAFTLTEVLLVSVMFTLISLAVYHAFANGFKLWARGERVMVEGDMMIFLDRFGEDLRQTVNISGIPFKGNATELKFPAIILALPDEHGSRAGEPAGEQIGAIGYKFDPAEKKIYRTQAVYGQALKSTWSQPVEVASQIENLTLQYYFKADRGLEALDETSQGIPMGVMVDIQFMVDNQVRHMRRFVLVPVGGGV